MKKHRKLASKRNRETGVEIIPEVVKPAAEKPAEVKTPRSPFRSRTKRKRKNKEEQ